MIGELIGDWIKGILIDGIMGNLSGLFSTVNTKVGEIASDVGATPQAWNGGIFNMLHTLSDTVIVPIAAAILAVIMCYELIDMIVEKNNMELDNLLNPPSLRVEWFGYEFAALSGRVLSGIYKPYNQKVLIEPLKDIVCFDNVRTDEELYWLIVIALNIKEENNH